MATGTRKSTALELKGRAQHSDSPLQGYSFYFESGTKDVKHLIGQIEKLGGYIETFLSKKVSYFIRSKDTKKTQRRSPRLAEGQSSRSSEILKRVYSLPEGRGKCPSTSTVDRAKTLGLSVHTVDKLAEWLNEVVESKRRKDQKKKNKPQTTDVTTAVKVHGLREPFVKTEDKRKRYSPLYKELTSPPPMLLFDGGNPHGSPFTRQNVTRAQSARLRATQPVSTAHAQKADLRKSNSASGFCELCSCMFTHRGHHMASAQHQGNITRGNYRELDKLISGGESFADFLSSVHGTRKPPSRRSARATAVSVVPSERAMRTKVVGPSKSDPGIRTKAPRGKQPAKRKESESRRSVRKTVSFNSRRRTSDVTPGKREIVPRPSERKVRTKVASSRSETGVSKKTSKAAIKRKESGGGVVRKSVRKSVSFNLPRRRRSEVRGLDESDSGTEGSEGNVRRSKRFKESTPVPSYTVVIKSD